MDIYDKGLIEIEKVFKEMELSMGEGIKVLAFTLDIAIRHVEKLDGLDYSEEVRKKLADYILNKGSYDVSKLLKD